MTTHRRLHRPHLLIRAALVGLGVALLWVATSAGPAAAAPPRKAADLSLRLSEEAQEAYLGGRFEEAVRLYLQAYDALPDPSILYNIGFIYERKLDDPDLAIGYYERVASSPEAPPELVEKASGRLASAQEAAAARRAASRVEPPEPPPPREEPVRLPAGDDGGPPSTIPPVITMAVGGAALVTGAVFGALAVDTQSRFTVARADGDPVLARELQSTGRGQALLGDALMIGGGVTLAAGLIWYLVASGSDTPAAEASTWRLSPGVVPSGAVLTFGGPL